MALVLGTNSGFVTVAPTADPNATGATIDGNAVVTKHTSPANAVLVTEIGWYRASGTNAANWEIGQYSDLAGVPLTRLNVDATNSTTSAGWIATAVSWAITPSTPYWWALQMDAHSGSSTVDSAASGGAGSDLFAAATLADPYAGGTVADADGMYAIYALVAVISAAVTGTATASITEADVVTGGKTIIITLTNDTWKAAGTGPIGSTADTQAIIDGITAASSPATGWNNVVKPGIETSDVVRTSATVCTITLDAEATYDITATETITVTVPAAATVSGVSVVAAPTFTVDSVATFSPGWAYGATSGVLGSGVG